MNYLRKQTNKNKQNAEFLFEPSANQEAATAYKALHITDSVNLTLSTCTREKTDRHTQSVRDSGEWYHGETRDIKRVWKNEH